ncbi:MAG: hypothetical protein ACOVNP_04320 [Flavobacterium sp.]|jgi:hypothetical protein
MISDNTQAEPLDKTTVKCRFFCQYFDQIVAKETKYPNSQAINTTTVFLINQLSNYHLELKPISKITDEDAISMYRGLERNYESSNQFLEDYKSIGFLDQSEVDFLRSKGYAVPYMQYSVDELIKMGWVQLV